MMTNLRMDLFQALIFTRVPGDGELQPPREGDLLGGDHGVHGLGQRGQAPRHHQAATTPATLSEVPLMGP